MTAEEFGALLKQGTKTYQVYEVLRNRKWHCRECEYTHVQTSQIAGGAGIQGLQRGSGSRPGMDIESGNHLCVTCDRQTRHDRWTGNFHESTVASSMPRSFQTKVGQVLGWKDAVELVERSPAQLTVDHKLPMLRWSEGTKSAQTNYSQMSDDDIRVNFQMLKKSNGSVSHNLLKSRSCETCYKTGKRGTPFGIAFFYAGGARWAPADKRDPSGCEGCGWYDFAAWRTALNKSLKRNS